MSLTQHRILISLAYALASPVLVRTSEVRHVMGGNGECGGTPTMVDDTFKGIAGLKLDLEFPLGLVAPTGP